MQECPKYWEGLKVVIALISHLSSLDFRCTVRMCIIFLLLHCTAQLWLPIYATAYLSGYKAAL